MSPSSAELRDHARAIWQAGVDAVQAEDLVCAAFADRDLVLDVATAERILVVGAGKAGAAMSAGVEQALAGSLDRVEGIVNVPAKSVRPLQAIRLHAARPAGINFPAPEGVAGTRAILNLLTRAGPGDVCICLLSGGGSALLPAPVQGVSLEDKLCVTHLLHGCGATINEMNAVRKHLSQCKGGQLAKAFRGRSLHSLIVSDVVGDALDVIASGPTAADPTTFADALGVLQKYGLTSSAADQVPSNVREYLEQGAAGKHAETLKGLPANVYNHVIGNNARALTAAKTKAESLGYRVLNLGAYIEGETRQVATVLAGIVRSIRANGQPLETPVCLLSGGETTVTLSRHHGLGGRNQEFVLAAASKLGQTDLHGVVVLSGGTDGEDGPTDAAGAMATSETLIQAESQGLLPKAFLDHHDAYHLFAATGDLLKTGLTETNVMDVRVVLVY